MTNKPESDSIVTDTPYQQLGGEAAIRQLVNAFYDRMEASAEADELRGMHATDLSPMRQTLFEFLSGWLGGPRHYFERANAKCIMSAHAALTINRRVADQWLMCMRHALQTVDAPDDTRAFIDNAFTRVCNAMVNR